MNAVFITGTDTHVGKTFVSCLLLRELNALGLKTFAIKPLASGCQQSESGDWRNDDALCLQTHSFIKQPYAVVNPIALKEPIAPHLAARRMGMNLSGSIVKKSILSSIRHEADINLIEGVGGWSVPLNDTELLSEVICELNIPVVLVVGIRLGCLNHAILTYRNMVDMNAPLVGWIANCLASDMPCMEDNIHTLQQWIRPPCLGVIRYGCDALGYIPVQTFLDRLSQHAGVA